MSGVWSKGHSSYPEYDLDHNLTSCCAARTGSTREGTDEREEQPVRAGRSVEAPADGSRFWYRAWQSGRWLGTLGKVAADRKGSRRQSTWPDAHITSPGGSLHARSAASL